MQGEQGAEPLPALEECGSPAAQPQLHCPCTATGLYHSSHDNSETLPLPWLLIFCQFRDLRWLSEGLDKCQRQHEGRRGEGVVEMPFLAEAESCSIGPIINGLFSMKCLVRVGKNPLPKPLRCFLITVPCLGLGISPCYTLVSGTL